VVAAPASRDRLGTTTVAADAECEGWTPEIPSPPFEERAIVIRVDWDGSDKYWYFYYATTADDPVNEWRTVDVDAGHHAHASGGCTPDAERCGRRDPLFLTEASLDSAYVRDGAPIPHNNHASAPGSYSLAALVGDVCTYPDDPGVISHYERYFQDMTNAPSEVKFSATIEYYERGAAQPHRTATRHTMVPLDNRLDMDLTGPSFTRVFGEPIVLAPASGASGVGSNGAAPWDREDSEVD